MDSTLLYSTTPALLLVCRPPPPASARCSSCAGLPPPARSIVARRGLARATLGLTEPAAVEPPQITFLSRGIDFIEWKGDILAVAISEKDMSKDSYFKFENSILRRLDEHLGGLLAVATTEEDFTGKAGQSTILRLPGLGFKWVALVGLGQCSPTSVTSAYQGIGRAVAAASKAAKASTAAVVLASGILDRTNLNAPSAIASGVLAEEALKVASLYSDVLTAKILDAEKCKELKMGSYLGVAAASSNPPHFIHLCYKPPVGDVKKKLAIVGKGLTFDSGGYNIKTGPGCLIELMKYDMGGSAAAFGAAKVIGHIKPPGVEVHFIVAACENMINGAGMRPGDIVTASNGKTIEVNNTDAEGRLTLADALVYACKLGVEKLVDLATLTGACVVALGPGIAGFFTPSEDLAKEIVAASETTGEKLWRMPLEESYWESMKSGVADMVNTGGRQGGAITAALFLKQFVDQRVQWLHIDMAGPVWNEKEKSATGFGVSTLVEWVLNNSA